MADLAQLNISLTTSGAEQAASALGSAAKALASADTATQKLQNSLNQLNNQTNTLNSIKSIVTTLNQLSASMSGFSGADSMMRMLDSFGQRTSSAQTKVNEFKAVLAQLQGAFSNAAATGNNSGLLSTINQVNEAINKLSSNRGAGGQFVSKMSTQEIASLRQELEKLSTSALASSNQIKTAFSSFNTKSTAQLAAEIKQIQTNLELIKPHVTSSDFAKFQAEASSSIKKLSGDLGEGQSAIGKFGEAFLKIAKYTLAFQMFQQLQQLPAMIYEANVKMEGLRKSFDGAFGGAAKGSQELNYAVEAANKYGKSIDSVANAYKKFAITSEYMGLSQETTRKVFESVTQAITKVGGSSDDVGGTLTALIQMLSKGTVSAEEFRLQFAERIPGAMKMGADALGVTTSEFKKLMAEGKIVATEFIPKLAEQMAIFGQGWEKSATSITANTERLKNNLTLLFESSGFQKGANATISTLNAVAAKLNENASLINKFNDYNDRISNGLLKKDQFGNMEKGFDVKAYDKYMSDWSNTSLDDKITSAEKRLDELAAKKEKILESRGSNGFLNGIFGGGGSGSWDLAKVNSQIEETKEIIKPLKSMELEASISKAITAIKSLQDEAAKGVNIVTNEEKVKEMASTLENQLIQKIKEAREEAAKNINFEANTKKIEEAETLLKSITGTNWQAMLVVKADTHALDVAMDKINKILEKTASGKLITAKEALTGVEQDLNKKEAAMANIYDDPSRLEEYNQLEKDRNKILEARRVLQADVLDQQRKASKENEQQWAVDAKYKDNTPYDKFGDFSKENKASMERKAKDAAAWIELSSSNFTDEASKRYKSDLANNAAAYDQFVAHLKKGDASGAAGAARHANAVDKLNTSLDNYLEKEMGLAGNDSLGAAFASAAEKANQLQSKVKDLAIKGGISVEETTQKIQQLRKVMEDRAVDKELSSLFPWLKKDDKLQGFFTDFYQHTEEMKQGAERAGISMKYIWEMLVKMSSQTPNVQALAKAMLELNNTTDLSEWGKKYEEIAGLKLGSGGEDEKALFKDIEDAYLLSSDKMAAAREEMYGRVMAAAQGSAEKEKVASALIQQDREDMALKQLQLTKKTGSATEAFSATVSEKLGLYKSSATRAREASVEFGDTTADAIMGMSDAVSTGMGDALKALMSGTGDMRDVFKSMLDSMLDYLMQIIQAMIKYALENAIIIPMMQSMTGGDSLSNQLGKTASSLTGSSSSGSGGGISDLITGGISKGLSSLFSSGASGATSLASAGLTGGITEAATGAIAPWATETAGAAMTGGVVPTMTGAMAPAALGTGLEAAGTASLSAGALSAGAMSGMATMGIGLVVGGLIAALGSGMFGEEEKEPTKTASGYNVGYKSGHATASGVDFYSDGSTVSTGATDPDVTKKIADAFRETSESLSDFAEELGFTVEVLDSFEFPTMDITEDQLDSYIRNGENQMAFQGLMEAGLRGAFESVLRDGEIYVDEFERLATSFSTVSGGLEAYGYELADVAMVSQENIDALRIKNTEVAEGTAMALATMAAAMGATSSFVTQIASDTSIAAAALGVTDEQLSNIIEADYASDLLDAVGGEDAFDAMMGNLTKNIFDTVAALAENLDYYNTKASTAISKLNESGVTVENFWEKFDEAIKGGLTVDQFEAWGKASTWVNQIDTVTEAMEDWNQSMHNMEGSLEARRLEALGMSEQAKYVTLLYNAENELYEARKNNYDEAIIAKIQEVQALEEARALYEISKKSTQGVQDINVREMEVTSNPFASIIQAYYENGWELQEAMESGLYSAADIARLSAVQDKEIAKLYDDLADSITEAAEAAHTKMLTAGGKTDAAALYDFQVQSTKELEDALESGLYTAESYSELMRAIALEAKNLEKTQARDRKSNFVDAFISGPLELEQQKNQHELTVLQDQISVAEAVKVLLDGTYQSIESAYNIMNSLATSLKSTLQGFKWNESLSSNTATQTFTEKSDYYAELLSKVNSTDKTDMDYSKNIGELQSFAGTYLEAAKSYYGASSEYWQIYDAVTGKLEGLQIDTQTDSDIYKEQLLAQKELVNNSQLQIDALTLANTAISEQLSVLSLMKATDELAYKQEDVAQNMTKVQLDGVITSLHGNGIEIAAMADAANVNASNQIAAQQAIYEAESEVSNVQVGELTLQTQLSQLALNNSTYQSQLLNAQTSILAQGVLNDQMTIALLSIQSQYAASLSAQATQSYETDAYYSSEIVRYLSATFTHATRTSGYLAGIHSFEQEIYSYTVGMYGYLKGIYDNTSSSASESSSYLGGFASGGEVTGPGWFMAGENGPEPVLLNGGSATVTSNGDFTGSVDTNTRVTAAGLSALLAEMKAMRSELAQIRATGQRTVATPDRN